MTTRDRRRRPIPEGSETSRLKITGTTEEVQEIQRQARDLGVSVSELMVSRTLNPPSKLSPVDAVPLRIVLKNAAEELARGRLERRENPADRDALDAYLKEATDEILDIVKELRK